ncbi:MAG: Rpn family recombination-promoting nuclease/putative transposase, partial [Planctomycetota bacterium]|nr:Rpn family recombination-promoting nuclease/putative transposase [Planctomycetota bacterium]
KVFLLLEHQSRSERHISFRIAEYVIKDFRERLNAKGSPGRGGKNFPFPLAIILHHGKTPWKGPLKMRDLVDGARELAPFLLDLPIFLVDLASIPEEEIKGKPTLRALLAALQAAGKGRLAERFGRILGFLAGSGRDSRLRGDLRTLINYLAVVDRPRLAEADIRRELDKLIGSKEAEEMTTSLAREWLREGEAKGRAEGEAEGEAKGRAEALILVLRARFGDPPAAVRNKLRKCADPGQLDRWAELAATCPSLGDFRKKL